MPQEPSAAAARLRTLTRRILRHRLFQIGLALLVLYTLAGFFLLPYLITRYVPRLAQDHLQRPARLGEVRFNPFTFTLEARDAALTEADGAPLAGFGRLFLDFEPTGIFRWAWTFKRIELEAPQIHLVMGEDGVLNFARLAPAGPAEPPAPEPDARPPRMLLQAIAIGDGRIEITDRRLSPPANLALSPLAVNLRGISTLPDREGPYGLEARLGDGGVLKWAGEVSLHPFRSHGEVGLEGLALSSLWEFLRDRLNTTAPAGRVHVQGRYALDLSGPEPQLRLDDLGLGLRDLALTLTGESAPFLALKSADLQDSRFDLASRTLELGRLAFSDGRVNLAVDGGGALNLARLVRTPPPAAAPAEAAAPSPGAGDAPPLVLKAPVIALDRLALSYRDASRTPELDAAVGSVRVAAAFQAALGAAGPEVHVSGIGVDLEGLHLGAAGADPLVVLERLGLEGGDFRLAERSLGLARVAVAGGRVDLVREADGAINLVQLAAPPQGGVVRREAEEAAQTGAPWQVAVQTFALEGVQVSIADRTVKAEGSVLDLAPLKVVLAPVDGRTPTAVDVEIGVVQGGRLALKGSVDPAGPSVAADIEVTDLALPPLQPYLDPLVNLLLRSGTFGAQGKLRYGVADAQARLAYDGGFKLDGLKLIEPGVEETFLGWRSLGTSQLKLRLDPNRLEIAELRLDRPEGKFIIAEDRTVNVAAVFKKPEGSPAPAEAAPPKAEAGAGFPVSVRRLRVTGGDLEFADLSLTPQFATRIHDLTGVVVGASSTPGGRAQVELDGQVDEFGTAKIEGEVNLFDPTGFLDMDVVFRNVEMTTLTPYSGRFAGRRIDSGKLSLDLEYRIEDRQLLGDNQIIVDRLELGERVESPDALNLPLDLALALLKDGDGVIDIGLPVKGDLSEPEFSFGRLIGKALVNLITKIATAPFRALGALLGGEGEGFDTVAFAAGDAGVPPPEAEKLQKLAQALQKRPNLNLTVQGRYHAEQDGRALRDLHVRRALAAQLEVALAPGEDPGPVDYGNPDTGDALEDLFRERFDRATFKELEDRVEAEEEAAAKAQPAAPKDPGRLAKALFARLVETEALAETELQELARGRGQAVADQLTGPGGIAPERVTQGDPGEADGDAPTAKLDLAAAAKRP